MSFVGWMGLVGALLLFMALSTPWVRRFPVSTSIIYLLFGLAIGPFGLALIRIDFRDAASWSVPLTEVAVIVSLFFGGLKLRLPLRAAAWSAAWRLAGPVMVLSIAAVTALLHLAFGLDLALSLLIGAVLAPTDPVLAGAVSVEDASDHDRLRYGLSGEAGLNDGMAFPFVVLALLLYQHQDVGTWAAEWFAFRVLWAVPAGLAIGYFAGLGIGMLAIALRSRSPDSPGSGDFLALALIALSYVSAEAVGAWGFLAVFATGVGFRRAETTAVGSAEHPPAEDLVEAGGQQLEGKAAAAGSIVAETLEFGSVAERLLEVLLVVLVGASLPVHWSPSALIATVTLFCVIRPLAVLAGLARTPTTWQQRGLMAWFGIRGIGSLFYLSYAIAEGLPRADITNAASFTVTTIAASIVLHGISATPLLQWYAARLSRREVRAERHAASTETSTDPPA
jgi:NhaP-type Na+/H+ or K+/H+ antiporter